MKSQKQKAVQLRGFSIALNFAFAFGEKVRQAQ